MMNTKTTALAFAVSAVCAAPFAAANTVEFDVTGIASWDAPGSANNEVFVIDMAAELGLASGSSVTVTGIGWDVSIATEGASWLSEANVGLNGEINVAPGVADGAPGTGDYTSGGIVDFTDAGLTDIILADGLLTLEFFESYDDAADVIDAFWTSGTLEIAAVPLPAAFPLMLTGLAGLFALGRRRAA